MDDARGRFAVMALIFALLTAALASLMRGARRSALAMAALALLLSAGLFLFEVHDPRDGFAMPWLQVHAAPHAPGAAV